MPELVVPTVEDAGRIAGVINERAIALGGATEESAAGVARWFALPIIDPAGGHAPLLVDDRGRPATRTCPARRTAPRRSGSICGRSAGMRPRSNFFRVGAERGAERVGSGGEAAVLRRRARRGTPRASHRCRLPLGDPRSRWSARSEDAGVPAVLPPTWGPPVRRARLMAGSMPPWRRNSRSLGIRPDEARGLVRRISPWTRTLLPLTGGLGRDEVAGVCINRPRRGEDEAGPGSGGSRATAVAPPRASARPARGPSALFAERGKRSAGLGVDAENTTGAVALYERVGMHAVRRSDTWERIA